MDFASLNVNKALRSDFRKVEWKLAGKVALIVGASGGLGREIARCLGLHQCRVVASYFQNRRPLEELARSLPKGNFLLVKLNLTNPLEVRKFIETAKSVYGRLDILVNTAGVTRDKLIVNLSEEDWNEVLGVNLTGVFYTIKYTLEEMIPQKQGVIINITSRVGKRGAVGQANYAAAKAGLIGFTKSLAQEVGKYNIRVNAIIPGFTLTGMTSSLPLRIQEKARQESALKSLGRAEDVAKMVLFLASAEAQNITGQIFSVDTRVGKE